MYTDYVYTDYVCIDMCTQTWVYRHVYTDMGI